MTEKITQEIDIKVNRVKSFSDSLTNDKKKGSIEKGIEAERINNDIGANLLSTNFVSIAALVPVLAVTALDLVSKMFEGSGGEDDGTEDTTLEEEAGILEEATDDANNIINETIIQENDLVSEDSELYDIDEVTSDLLDNGDSAANKISEGLGGVNDTISNFEQDVNPEAVANNATFTINEEVNSTGNLEEGATKISNESLANPAKTYADSLKDALNTEKSSIESVTMPTYQKLSDKLVVVMQSISSIYNVDLSASVDAAIEEREKQDSAEFREKWGIPENLTVDFEYEDQFSNMGGMQTTVVPDYAQPEAIPLVNNNSPSEDNI